MELVLFFFLLQGIHIFADKKNYKEYIEELKETFNFDLTQRTKAGEIIAWRISKDKTKFKPLSRHEITGPFQHDETILILAHKEEKSAQFYYWLGTTAPVDDKKTLATYAMKFYVLTQEYYDTVGIKAVVHLTREYQGVETLSFKETLDGLIDGTSIVKPEEIGRFIHSYQEYQLPSNIPNLYVVRGQGTNSIKKVPLHPDWLDVDDACLILETGFSDPLMKPINVLCGPKSSANARGRSKLFVDQFHYYGNEMMIFFQSIEYDRFITNRPSDKKHLKKFEEVMKSGNQHNSHEIDDPQDRTGSAEEFVTRNNNDVIVMYYNGISKEEDITQKPIYSELFTVISERPIHSKLFTDTEGVYIVDTKSAAGLFLIMGTSSKMHIRTLAAEAVEDYLHRDPPNQTVLTRVRIMGTNLDFGYNDFTIHLADWPKNPKGIFW